MNCEICGKDPGDLTVILPIPRESGNLITMACLECARKSGVYCLKHNQPYSAFKDGTTACLICIEELKNFSMTEAAALFLNLRRDDMPESERLREWAEEAAFITTETPIHSIARALAGLALRRKTTVIQILEEIAQKKSVSDLLPSPF
jgi:hypothetical protein